jgi:hypothetical protein
VGDDTEVFVGLDVAKARHAMAIGEGGRQGDVRIFCQLSHASSYASSYTSRVGSDAGPLGIGSNFGASFIRCPILLLASHHVCPRIIGHL